jgi:putative hydrolase of the HAD superfamily
MRVRGIIFDWGNTLVDVDLDWDEIYRVRRRIMAEHLASAWGVDDAPALVEEYVRLRLVYRERSMRELYEHGAVKALREAMANLGVEDPGDGAFEGALHAFYATETPLIRPFPDALHTLRELRRRGFLLALVSNNTWAPAIRASLEPHGLLELLDPDLHSSEVRIRKPDPAMLAMVLRRWALGPSEVVVVGDKRDRDIVAAQRIGMRSVWARMRPEHEVTPEAEATTPDAEIRSLSELLDLLQLA